MWKKSMKNADIYAVKQNEQVNTNSENKDSNHLPDKRKNRVTGKKINRSVYKCLEKSIRCIS